MREWRDTREEEGREEREGRGQIIIVSFTNVARVEKREANRQESEEEKKKEEPKIEIEVPFSDRISCVGEREVREG